MILDLGIPFYDAPPALLAGPVRYLASGAALVTVFVWAASATHQWHLFGAREQRISLAVGAVLLAVSYGLYEAAHEGVPFGSRVVWIFLAVLSLLGALAFRWDDHDDTRDQ